MDTVTFPQCVPTVVLYLCISVLCMSQLEGPSGAQVWSVWELLEAEVWGEGAIPVTLPT